MSKVENLQTTNRAEPFPCVSVALVVLAMFVLSWLAAQGVRNNLQPLLIFAGLCLPIFIAELRNHHNKWAIIAFDAVPVITYAFGYLVLRGPVLTGSMVLFLNASAPSEIDAAFATMPQRRANAVLVTGDPFFTSRRQQIVALATRDAIPAMYANSEFVADGGLMSYGNDIPDAYRRNGPIRDRSES